MTIPSVKGANRRMGFFRAGHRDQAERAWTAVGVR
jgi:hypothetical protein